MSESTKKKPAPKKANRGKRGGNAQREELDSPVIDLTVDGEDCTFPSYADLTLGEQAEIEAYFDKPLAEIGAQMASVRGGIITAYIARKRVDPMWTLAKTEALRPDQVEVRGQRPTEIPADTGGQS